MSDTKPATRPIVAEAAQAVATLRGMGSPLSLAVADHLEETARYWQQWMPLDPTAIDRTALALARTVNSTTNKTSGRQQPNRQPGTKPTN